MDSHSAAQHAETVIDIVLELDQLASKALQSLHGHAANPTTAADTTMRITSEVYVARSIFMIASALEKIALASHEHAGMVLKDGNKPPTNAPPQPPTGGTV